jgi:hypothetical protein
MKPQTSRAARLTTALIAVTLCGSAVVGWGGEALASRPAATGIAGLPATAILTRSAAALNHENTIAISGSMRLGNETIVLQISSTGRGKSVAGDIDIKTAGTNSGTVRFVDVGANVYLEAALPFWKQELASAGTGATGSSVAAVVLSKLAGRWIEISGSEASSFSSSFGGLTEPGKFAQSLLAGNGTLIKGAPRVLRGRRVLPISSSKGGTIYVSLTGAPLPIGIVGTQVAGGKTVTANVLFDYPATVTINPPSGAVTLSQIVKSLLG